MTAATIAKKPKVTVGSLIDKLSAIRTAKRDLAAQEKVLNAEYEGLQTQLLELMDSEGLSKSTGRSATASITTSRQYTPENWDTFVAYAAKIKRFDLVQRRVSAPAVRELWEMKGPVPGLTPYDKREISLRDL